MTHNMMPRTALFAALGTALLMGTVVAGCSSRNTEALERARANYLLAAHDPTIATYAPVPLQEAETLLGRAERAEEQKNLDHFAYLADQKVSTAHEVAQQKVAEAETERLAQERERVVLDARTREARLAQHQAQLAQQQVEDARMRVEQLTQELAEFKARETDRGLVLTIGDVLFEYDRADLKPGALRNLYPLVTFLRENPTRTVAIEGHADSTGSDSYNLDLSQRRAESVRAFLVQSGVRFEQLNARGLGEEYPVASNTNETGRQQNRRVELTVLNDGTRTTTTETRQERTYTDSVTTEGYRR